MDLRLEGIEAPLVRCDDVEIRDVVLPLQGRKPVLRRPLLEQHAGLVVLGDDKGTGVLDQGLRQAVDQGNELFLVGWTVECAGADKADLGHAPRTLPLQGFAGKVFAWQ